MRDRARRLLAGRGVDVACRAARPRACRRAWRCGRRRRPDCRCGRRARRRRPAWRAAAARCRATRSSGDRARVHGVRGGSAGRGQILHCTHGRRRGAIGSHGSVVAQARESRGLAGADAAARRRGLRLAGCALPGWPASRRNCSRRRCGRCWYVLAVASALLLVALGQRCAACRGCVRADGLCGLRARLGVSGWHAGRLLDDALPAAARGRRRAAHRHRRQPAAGQGASGTALSLRGRERRARTGGR